VKTVIFDFDGTIADSFETFLGIFEEIAARPERLTPSEVKDLRGKSMGQIVEYLKIKRWQIPRYVLKAKKLIAIRIGGIKTFSGMPETLKQLDEAGHRMFILSTNSSKTIDAFLRANDLDGYFIKVYGDIGLRSKSSALKKIIKKEKLKATDCAYVGDEVRDVVAAKKAGIMSVAVSWGFNYPTALKQAGPSALAAEPKDLIKILS
jgi:phosphoglycolate phosphatase